jgi:hypothetical protein
VYVNKHRNFKPLKLLGAVEDFREEEKRRESKPYSHGSAWERGLEA